MKAAERRRRDPRRRRPRQRARHEHAGRRHRRVQRAAPGLRRALDEHRRLGHEGVDRAPARRRRRDRGDVHGARPPRAHGSADDQPHRAGPRDPARRRHGAAPARRRHARRDLQLVRLRRAQRRRRVPHAPDPGGCRRMGTGPDASRRRGLLVAATASLVRPPGRSTDLASRHPAASPSAHLVQPDDRGEVARVAERLELVVPRLPEREAELAVQLDRRRTRRSPSRSGCGPRARRCCPPCRSARRTRRGRACASSGRRRSRARVLAHLEPQLLPAAERRGELRAGAGLALPVELGAQEAGEAPAAPTQSKFTAVPRARPAAHSTCGHSARGEECTNSTPRAARTARVTFSAISVSVLEVRLPLRPRNRRTAMTFDCGRRAVIGDYAADPRRDKDPRGSCPSDPVTAAPEQYAR